MSKTPGKALTVTGLGGLGAVIGGVVGGCGGVLIALFWAGSGALNWYRAQPPDWSVVTGFCAIIFVLVAVLIIAVIGALVCGLLGGLGSMLFSAVMLARNK